MTLTVRWGQIILYDILQLGIRHAFYFLCVTVFEID
jgi:hypothetical protein